MNGEIYPWQIKVYLASLNIFQKVIKLLNACFIGFWLGFLKTEDIHLVDDIYYNKTRQYRDESYNLSGLWQWEKQVLERYFSSSKSLLVGAVGGGREALALCKLGYEVDAFECNSNLVEFANQLMQKEGYIPNIKIAPRDRCPDSDKKYDGIIVGWGAYMLIQGKNKRIAFLQSIHQQAKVNAPLLISFFDYSGIQTYHKIIAKIANLIKVFLGGEPIEAGDSLVPDYVHYFTKDEIEREFQAAGFELIMYSNDEYGHAVGLAK